MENNTNKEIRITSKARVTWSDLDSIRQTLGADNLAVKYLAPFLREANKLLKVSEKQLRTPYCQAKAEIEYGGHSFMFIRGNAHEMMVID